MPRSPLPLLLVLLGGACEGSVVVGQHRALPPCPTAPGERQVVTRVDLGTRALMAGSANRQVVLGARANGETDLAFGDNLTVHVMRFDRGDRLLGESPPLAPAVLRGFAPSGDGHALLHGPMLATDPPSPLSFSRFGPDGARLARAELVERTAGDREGDLWPNARVPSTLVRAGNRWAAYLSIDRRGPTGIEAGDKLVTLDDGGRVLGEGWQMRCPSPRNLRLAWNGRVVGALCAAGGSSSGIMFGGRTILSEGQAAPAAGPLEVSELVPDVRGFVVAASLREGRGSADVALLHLADDGTIRDTDWLTATPDAEDSSPSLARYGSSLLVTWRVGARWDVATGRTTGGAVQAVVVASDGARAPVTVTTARRVSDLTTLTDGDIGWVAAGVDEHELLFVRLRACR